MSGTLAQRPLLQTASPQQAASNPQRFPSYVQQL
jgi:hypothetical protein